MNKIYQIVICILVIFVMSCEKQEESNNIQSLNCLPTNLQNGVIAFYSFGGGSLNDSSGNNYNLTNPTTASSGMDRDGNPNCAYQFNNVNNEFLKYPDPTFLDNLPANNLSISFWYKSNDLLGSYGSFISRDDQQYCNSSFGEWSIGYVNNVLAFGVNNGQTYHYGVENSNWEHIVVTSSNTSNQIFVNGVLMPDDVNGIYTPSCPILNQGDLFIGRLYNGLIDDIIIYNRILSPAEANELFNLSVCCN